MQRAAYECVAWWMCAGGRRLVVRRGLREQQLRAALFAKKTKAVPVQAVASSLTASLAGAKSSPGAVAIFRAVPHDAV